MFRSERTLAGVTLAALVALMGCGKAREDHSQQVAPTPVPASVSQQAIEEDANIGPAAPPEDEQGGVAEVGSGSGGGGSAGAPAPEPDPGMTREEYLALIKRNEDLRADIRATNPKLQLIIDGKFDEFERLLDKEPRLATVRWGYCLARYRINVVGGSIALAVRHWPERLRADKWTSSNISWPTARSRT